MPPTFRDPRPLWRWLALVGATAPLHRPRAVLTWCVLLVSGVGVALTVWLPGGKSAFQAGPVSAAHSSLQNDCNSCHRKPFAVAARLLCGDSPRSVPDMACAACHAVGGHHDAFSTPDCAACHREHTDTISLVRVSDWHCLGCHADLSAHCSQPTSRAPVSGFPDGHPPMRSRTDPVQLHFSHAAHLRRDGVLGPDRSPRHLDCADCHRPDELGRFMQPVRYTEHCASCHPLSVQLAGGSADPEVRSAWKRFTRQPAPHTEPWQVRTVLRERLVDLFRDGSLIAGRGEPSRSVPWPAVEDSQPTLWRRMPGTPGESVQSSFVQAQLTHLESILFQGAGGCNFCHVPIGDEQHPVSGRLPQYARTQVPQRWLESARFHHEAHRMLNCTDCHPAQESTWARDVLIPDLEVCARCHNARAGARHDCAECHTYHKNGSPVGVAFNPP
jgi:hypothetical protein